MLLSVFRDGTRNKCLKKKSLCKNNRQQSWRLLAFKVATFLRYHNHLFIILLKLSLHQPKLHYYLTKISNAEITANGHLNELWIQRKKFKRKTAEHPVRSEPTTSWKQGFRCITAVHLCHIIQTWRLWNHIYLSI